MSERKNTHALVGFGQATGEYIGNGKGEQNDQTLILPDSEENGMEIEPAEEHLYDFDDDLDIETTGLSIYDDHITEMAAKVVGMPQSGISQPSFTSLVHTSRNISKKGKSTTKKITVIYQIFLL